MKFLAILRAGIPVAMMIAAGIVVLIMIKSAKEDERKKVVLETIETLKERDEINGEVETLDLPAICSELGGKWVSNSCQ